MIAALERDDTDTYFSCFELLLNLHAEMAADVMLNSDSATK